LYPELPRLTNAKFALTRKEKVKRKAEILLIVGGPKPPYHSEGHGEENGYPDDDRNVNLRGSLLDIHFRET
jgi:hypothetical protein